MSVPLMAQQTIALLHKPVRELPRSIKASNATDTELHFEVVRGMIYLQAQLDEESALFVFDTGAPTLVLNESKPEQQGADLSAYSCTGELAVGSRRVSSFSWGSQTHRELAALTVDLSHLGQAEQRPRGLIGYELFKSRILCIDYQSKTLSLLNRRQWKRFQENAEPIARFSFELYGHLPVIKLRTEPQTYRFGIDTGAAANLISPAALADFSYRESSEPREALQGLDQQVQMVEAVELLKLWPTQTAAHRFLLTDLSAITANSEWELDGLLGYEFLSRYRVVIDYPRRELSIWPL
ncbi:MAG: hypothetical protein D6772_11375 [Bacteroidetes bacterium]|nr:MAG: hypothetical protein D6772_11375 [Bacteroidota bacterium]